MLASIIPFTPIPALEIPIPVLGTISLQPFGMLVATGVLVGAWLVRVRSEKLNLNEDHMRTMMAYVLVGGFVGAHVFDVLAYQPDKLADDPLLLIKLWAGISSFGGFLGGFFAFLIYLRVYKLPLPPYGDACVYGLTAGFTIGRIGCSVVSDHPGAPTDFWLGFDYPAGFIANYPELYGSGVPTEMRLHNLGLYELIYLAVVCAILYTITIKRRPHGFVAAFVGLAYAPVRFNLEFLRLDQSDPRYIGLTFAQWTAVAMFLGAAYYMHRIYKTTREHPELRGEPLPDIPGPGEKEVRKTAGRKVPRASAKKKRAAGARKNKAADKSGSDKSTTADESRDDADAPKKSASKKKSGGGKKKGKKKKKK